VMSGYSRLLVYFCEASSNNVASYEEVILSNEQRRLWEEVAASCFNVPRVGISSSSSSCIGLSSVAAPQIWLTHLFLGRPRLLFPVGLYDNM
jgi:hypothetical protein